MTYLIIAGIVVWVVGGYFFTRWLMGDPELRYINPVMLHLAFPMALITVVVIVLVMWFYDKFVEGKDLSIRRFYGVKR